PPTPALSTLSLHDALPISATVTLADLDGTRSAAPDVAAAAHAPFARALAIRLLAAAGDRRLAAELEAQPTTSTLGDVVAMLDTRSEEHTSELQSLAYLVCR